MVVVPKLCFDAAPLFIANPGIVSIVNTLAMRLRGQKPCKLGKKEKARETEVVNAAG